MQSGSETLTSIDQALRQVRQQMQELDQKIRSATEQLGHLGQQALSAYQRLAQMRLDQLASGAVVTRLDDADRRVGQLLEQRIVQLQQLDQRLQECDRREEELAGEREQARARLADAVDSLDKAEAATQQRLDADPTYQQQWEKSQAADRLAGHAEEKTRLAEQDRTEKGKPYEADSLFMYLWSRGYGTSAYASRGLIRMLDNWVARLIRFHDARPNYAMLLEIPVRLREHAQRLRSAADQEVAVLRSMEEKAAADDGIPALRDAMDAAQLVLDEKDSAIEKLEGEFRRLSDERVGYASGQDPLFQQCIQILVDEFQGDSIRELREEAEATATADDNMIVERLEELDQQREDLRGAIEQHRQMHQRYLDRLQELESIRQRFKRQHYDDSNSTFANGAMIGAILTEFLRGVANSHDVWDTLQRNQRHVPRRVDPGFGSGGLGGGIWKTPTRRSSGRSSSGGFRTGGGVRSGGFRTAGSFGGGRAGGGRSGGGFRTGGGF
jgi:DNA repair exonuclease SbcCD ATPase subunit